MDHDARQMFEELPDDLRERGWTNARQESTIHRLPGIEWYAVVFLRPFEPGTDDEALALVVRAHRKSMVRVSTNSLRSASWEAAFYDAIGLMRDADARRPVLAPSLEQAP